MESTLFAVVENLCNDCGILERTIRTDFGTENRPWYKVIHLAHQIDVLVDQLGFREEMLARAYRPTG